MHKCTDGEILMFKTVLWQYKQQDMKMHNKQQYAHFTQWTMEHNIQYTHFLNIHIVNCILKKLIDACIAFIYDLQ